ncbi:MAG: ATP-binding protein [Bacillota bacterium]|nr:ATP-binding protein [Bacillota bacterium]
MKHSLRTRLALSYAFVAIVCILIISIATNVFMEKRFRVYTIQNQERKNEQLVNLISKQYDGRGDWDYNSINDIGVNAIGQGMIIKISDISGKVLLDASLHNNGLCKQMLEHMAENMNKYYPYWNGKYQVKSYPINYKGSKVAILEVGYYGPFYYNDNDIAFIGTLNKLLISVGVFSLAFALILGALMAKYLSTPIVRVIRTAENISSGYLKNRVIEKSKVNEINLLTSTINNLASTLEKQEILRKRMSADVAHELRTPLTTLQGNIEGMIDGIWNTDKERLKSCYEEIVRIIGLVGKLEKLAEYESDSYKLNKTKYNILHQVQSIKYNFESDFISKGVKLNISGKNEIVFADKDKISQVIINLLSNALKYTPTGGEVEISVVSKKDTLELIIKDTGQGILQEDLPYIFERFYRADKSRNRLTGGSGIGLTIVKAIIDAHEGTITVESDPNRETKFIVSLPKN